MLPEILKNLGIFCALMSAQLNLRTHSEDKTRQLSENLKSVNKRLDVNICRSMSTRESSQGIQDILEIQERIICILC